MAVRRLHAEQPEKFEFSTENQAWANQQIAKYPPGKQASAVIPLLWRAQEQADGWLPEPAIRYVCDMLDMAYIRGLEIATFYTMFQLAPVGSKAHIQVCGTTPCMLRGSEKLIEICRRRIAPNPHQLSANGTMSWEEVECIGNCANAPVVQIYKDTYEDLTASLFENVLDAIESDKTPLPGSQTGRKASCPQGGQTTLTDSTLYDGSTIGAWRARFEQKASHESAGTASEDSNPEALASPAHKRQLETGATPEAHNDPGEKGNKPHPAALAAIANAGLVDDLEKRSDGKPLSTDELSRMKVDASGSGHTIVSSAPSEPERLSAPRDGKGDDLGLIWGVADTLAEQLNDLGIWHFDQIAKWTPANVAWLEGQLENFKGRVVRDKWIEQCQKLATGWRPESDVGERPED